MKSIKGIKSTKTVKSKDSNQTNNDQTNKNQTNTNHVNDNVEIYDSCYGALVGGFIGDALGGRYEFDNNYLKQIAIDTENDTKFLDILGEGCWKLVPGQVTDDSELAVALAQNIIDNGKPEIVSLAARYIGWYNSDPFDIGNTTRNSFSTNNVYTMLNASKDWNEKSQKEFGTNALSNGALMRIAPMCIFCAGYLKKQTTIEISHLLRVREFLEMDTILTHYSNEALNYSFFFLLLTVSGILYGRMNTGVRWIKTIKDDLRDSEGPFRILCNATNPDAILEHDPKVMMGDMRIAYQLAIRKAIMCQTGSMTFEEALISTIKLGGDTDTNACIVGILCGSVVGCKNIPLVWKNSVEQSRPKRYEKYTLCQHISNSGNLSVHLFNCGFSNKF